ncbi:cation:proton antiporter [Gordonia sp. ABSL1-1]|uniref:cation:proton antiporter n=1 Tax=Gordonia sp. ABSL1-1 TaxID=3053923 RepID=UPI002572E7B7|nr:cation:proton antiporter [Gordonia sp. ABSL1-1]MDL9938256.1 cation:proton antiporter [Gordonia sp. ABSL1-1]
MDKHMITFLLLDVAVIIAAARIGGRIAVMLRQPPVVGEIAVGIALGPSLLGLFPGDIDTWLFPMDVRPQLNALAQIGLVLFMFIVGLELDMRLTRGRERASASISLCSIAAPFALGALLAVVLYSYHDTVDGEQISFLAFALFLGIAMSITAFPVLARILTDRGMMRTVPGVFSLAAAAIDDVVAWTLLAFVIAIISGGSPLEVARIVGFSLLYAAVMFWVIRPLLARLVAWRSRAGRMTPDILAVILVGLFASATITDVIGIHQIFGAFLFGAMMPKVGAEQLHREILERLEQASVLLLLPMFFVVTGFAVHLGDLGPAGLWQLVLILLVAIAGKFAGAYIGARSASIPGRQSAAIAVLMNTRGLTELVILNAGLTLGVLTTDLFSMMVLMALITTILTEPLLRLVYPDTVVANDIAAAERRALAAGTENRVMLVVTDLDADVDHLLVRHRLMVAAARGYDVVLAGILPAAAKEKTLEVGVPVIPDLAAMASAVEKLNGLGARLPGVGAVSVLCRFNTDPAADLDEMAINAMADFIYVDAADREVADAVTAAPAVTFDEELMVRAASGEVTVTCVAGEDRNGRTAILVAGGIALGAGAPLRICTGMSKRRLRTDLGAITAAGVEVTIEGPGTPSDTDGLLVESAVRRDVANRAEATHPVAITVVDHTGTSEEALGERCSQLFGNATSGLSESTDRQPVSSITPPTERH